ncbi:pectate lyase isoform X2 [Gossypium hirsutum]|uniref:Pectate lyase n=1 Tax=Gossypium hirsutum TaxID=3635 RepID=A0ABM3A796_GOSHI|nr:pectate lyase-like isoform X2 [Gossypium hirsutum]
MRGEPMWKFVMALVSLSNLRRISLSMAFKSITLFLPRVARSRMVKTTMGYGVTATEMGSLFLEQPMFGSTIFPFTIALMALSMSFKDQLMLPFLTATSLTTTIADKKMQVTVALNHFGKGLVERMPRCRFGFIHVVNNDYNHWFLYAIGGTNNPTIISQGNRYSAPGFGAKEVTCRGLLKPAQWKNWNWVSQGDHFESGAFFTPSGNPSASKRFGADKMMPFKPGQMVPELTKYAGPLSCSIGRPY